MREPAAFRIGTPQAELDDLRARLRAVRWPAPEPVAGWSQDVPVAYMRELCTYWSERVVEVDDLVEFLDAVGPLTTPPDPAETIDVVARAGAGGCRPAVA